MFDTNLMLRTTGDLTATANGSSIDYGQGGFKGAVTFWVIVPQATGTEPTLDLVIQESDASNHSPTQDLHTLPQITAAGVYEVSFRPKHRYIRFSATTGGTSPNFGVVVIGPRMQGEYTNY